MSWVVMRFGESGRTHDLEEESGLWTQGLLWGEKKAGNKDKAEVGLLNM